MERKRTTVRDTICENVRHALADADAEPSLVELVSLVEEQEESGGAVRGTNTVGWIEAWADTEE
jgi:hypothetical protein